MNGERLDIKKSFEKAKDLFSEKLGLTSKKMMGIDIGLNSVKVAVVDARFSSKKFTLLNYASVRLPEGALIEDEIQQPEEIAQAIKEAVEKADITLKNCVLGLSGPNTLTRRLQLAGGSLEEIEDQVIWESEQYLPFDVEDSTIDFHVIGENAGGGVDVVVAAAKNDVVDNFKELLDSCDLKVKVIDTSMIAVTNMFEVILGDKLKSTSDSFLIIDIGAQKSSFIVYKNQMMVFTKEIMVGGIMITEEIQRKMGVNYFEAEDLKIIGDENGNLPEEILEIIDEVVENFFSEIKKAIDFYITSTSDESLETCYITGGSSQIPGFLEGLEALLGIPVSMLNPFDVFQYSEKKFDEEQIKEISQRGVEALGLALRGASDD